ncbi:MAG: hypothetical protein V8S58_14405 [Lachnospiraceae bacterium]
MIELDVFGTYKGLMLVEVEFAISKRPSTLLAPPSFFGEDVTLSGKYQQQAEPDALKGQRKNKQEVLRQTCTIPAFFDT